MITHNKSKITNSNIKMLTVLHIKPPFPQHKQVTQIESQKVRKWCWLKLKRVIIDALGMGEMFLLSQKERL